MPLKQTKVESLKSKKRTQNLWQTFTKSIQNYKKKMCDRGGKNRTGSFARWQKLNLMQL